MSSQVTQLKDFRIRQRKQYLKRYGERLDQHIQSFLRTHSNCEFMQLAREYLRSEASFQLESWDYQDFRDLLTSAIQESLGQELRRSLEGTSWFNSKIIGFDEVIERCTSAFILDKEILLNSAK